jgi:hypothetical protein
LQLLKLLKPTDTNWQPQDFLPDPSSPDFMDQVMDIQKRMQAGPAAHRPSSTHHTTIPITVKMLCSLSLTRGLHSFSNELT